MALLASMSVVLPQDGRAEDRRVDGGYADGLALSAKQRGREGWSFVVLPDTQHYAEHYPEIFKAQTQWVAERREALGIRFVLHAGDVTNHNSNAEWQVARQAFRALDGVVPYVIAHGNHDMGERGQTADRESLFSRYFLPQEIESQSSFGGSFEPRRHENSFHVFELPGGPWLVLALEFAPRDAVLGWADEVLRTHRQMPAIVLTHAYLDRGGALYDIAHYLNRPVIQREGGNGGEGLWNKLLRRHDNVALVLCGHNHHAARRVSRTDGGVDVQQLLADYQDEPLGGAGFLRWISVDPRSRRAHVYTYSPFSRAHKIDPQNRFSVPLLRRSGAYALGRLLPGRPRAAAVAAAVD